MLTDRDIPGWFPEVNRNHLISLIHTHSVKTVLEIGSFLGKSTVFFAQRVELVCCVDPFCVTEWMPVGEIKELERLGVPWNWFEVFLDNLLFASVADRVKPYQSTSGNGIPVTWPRKFDLVYIDGDHRYETVRQDINVYGAMARIVCGDDYGVADGVTHAVDEEWINPAACKAGPFWWNYCKG